MNKRKKLDNIELPQDYKVNILEEMKEMKKLYK